MSSPDIKIGPDEMTITLFTCLPCAMLKCNTVTQGFAGDNNARWECSHPGASGEDVSFNDRPPPPPRPIKKGGAPITPFWCPVLARAEMEI